MGLFPFLTSWRSLHHLVSSSLVPKIINFSYIENIDQKKVNDWVNLAIQRLEYLHEARKSNDLVEKTQIDRYKTSLRQASLLAARKYATLETYKDKLVALFHVLRLFYIDLEPVKNNENKNPKIDELTRKLQNLIGSGNKVAETYDEAYDG